MTAESSTSGNHDHANDHEPISAEDIEVDSSSETSPPKSKGEPKNAFQELMSSSHTQQRPGIAPKKPSVPPKKYTNDPRNNLLEYIKAPQKSPEVIEYDDEFVVIKDRFPKASIHLLILPRDPAIYDQHPLQALSNDAEFLERAKERADKVKKLAASELRRLYGQGSQSDKPWQTAYEKVMTDDSLSDSERDSKLASLPKGRDWESEIKVGVHTHPSMNHLHIHVMSKDMHSPALKHKKHYLSFNSSFFVGLDEFPLEKGSPRFKPGDWPSWDMKCWRCGRNFQNKFASLKRHLDEEEFEAWKRE
ncbi:HIT-like protein [Sporormia fimetaria CBS 119925]|uniref:Aprataxin-like protein n=1 Tax=Sporormia fimetaria CBS 119925 TaxID=1340428 RepID=A0A6A6V5J1_9PLEO|nr:HIT-like protein [Sporormia fimetaria CBS 119925]